MAEIWIDGCRYITRDEYDAMERAAFQAQEMAKEIASKLDAALSAMETHGIHVEKSWCWCNPSVTDYAVPKARHGGSPMTLREVMDAEYGNTVGSAAVQEDVAP